MGNRMKARIVGIGTYRLIFNTGCYIDLENCLFVPECARNLVSVSRLDDLGFNFKIGHGVFSLYRKDYFYGNESRGVNIKEIRVEDSSPVVPTQVVVPVVGVQPNTEIEQQNEEHTVPLNQEIENAPIAIQEQHIVPQVPLRRSIRERRSAITDDYVVYDVEIECDLSLDEEPKTFRKAMESENSEKWNDMKSRTSLNNYTCESPRPYVQTASEHLDIISSRPEQWRRIRRAIGLHFLPGGRYGSDEALTDLKSKKEPQSTKIVAMHRVRWNVNKGRERWLYSGGAAGIVRRQENKWSDVDICLAMKR
ncbi:hypothetical protein DKX38_023620 [Salix brachista]|uniref:Retrovirus-related Pol polyprotein from transposon TNT 1-94-like beta-barrel domain-containing protein n=1 Tax=Salix brachista TaxID=2182728 RepID=A0A5N5JJB3_9ROSI|nr:hypothetical protein DKX38_023620 [Salix brachista]